VSIKDFGDNTSITISPSRSGLASTFYDSNLRSREYFRGLNESITETLALSIFENILDSTNVSTNLKDFLGTLKDESFEDDSVKVGIRYGENQERVIESNGYPYHRMVFKAMVRKIFDHNQAQYPTIKDVEKVFFEAYFTGNFEVVAKTIDSTFGKGTLKKMAQADEFSEEVFAEAIEMSFEGKE